MGAAAVPIMYAVTAASTAYGVYSSQQTAAMQEEDARARGRQAAAQAREQEIDRLSLFRKVAAENTARMAAGGIAMEGTLADIQEGNIATLEEDVAGIQATGAAQQQYFGKAASNARAAGQMGSFSAILKGASGATNIAQSNAYVQAPTSTGTITGVS